MAKCAKCTKGVTKRVPGVQCNKCNRWLHGSCASLSTDQLSALSSTDSVDWKCNHCATTSGGKPKRISVILPDAEDEDSEFDTEEPMQKKSDNILQEIRKEVRNMREMVREIIRDELQSTLKFYSAKIDEYEEKIQNYETRVKLMENQTKNLSNTCKNLELKNGVLEQKMNKLEQARSLNDIEICGIVETEKENLKQIASTVGQILNKMPEDILKVHRKKSYARQGSKQANRAITDAPIIVTLREGSKDAWLRTAKETNIYLRDLKRDREEDSNAKIYLRAALSPTTAYLLWKAKTDLRDKSLCKYVWCNEGTVMVRKAEGDKKIFYVRSNSDIEVIRKELMKK